MTEYDVSKCGSFNMFDNSHDFHLHLKLNCLIKAIKKVKLTTNFPYNSFSFLSFFLLSKLARKQVRLAFFFQKKSTQEKNAKLTKTSTFNCPAFEIKSFLIHIFFFLCLYHIDFSKIIFCPYIFSSLKFVKYFVIQTQHLFKESINRLSNFSGL